MGFVGTVAALVSSDSRPIWNRYPSGVVRIVLLPRSRFSRTIAIESRLPIDRP